ncbi:MAG TPA: hypothetical protein VGN37_12355 [Actinocatenispora sp.]
MSDRIRLFVASPAGAAGAALWAYCLAVVTPPTEPDRSARLAIAGNNTYWVRDVRWAALVVVVAAVVLVARGDRVRSALSVLGGATWAAADVVLDRAQIGGPAAAIGLAAGGAAVSTGACLAVRLGRRRPRRWPVASAAAVVGTLGAILLATESPSDREATLDPVTWAVAVLLAPTAIALAASLVPSPPRWTWALVVASGLVPAALRLVPPGHRLGPVLLWAAALATALALLCRADPWIAAYGRPRRIALLSLLTLTVLGVASSVGLVAQLAVPMGERLTAWAGNVPVNGADSDILVSAVGVLDGLAVVALWAGLTALRPDPVPTEA